MGLCVSRTAVLTKQLNNKAKSNFKRAEKLFHSAKYIESIQLLDRALSQQPDYSEALFLKGNILNIKSIIKENLKT